MTRHLGAKALFERWGYTALAVVLFAALAAQTLNAQWSSDAFEHLAVLRELALRPLHPHHPLVPVDAAHPYFSPYMVGLGLFTKVSGLSVLSVFKMAGIANAALLLAAFWRFAFVVTGRRSAAAYGLLAVVLLWGPTAWRWSGFLNLGSIGYGLPYPSTFATAIMLLVLAEFDVCVRSTWTTWRTAAIAVGSALVVLSHPITGMALGAGLLAFWIGRGRRLPERRDAPLLAVGVVVVAALLVWPYYSFLELIRDSSGYSSSHALLYRGLPLRLLPLLILVPLLFVRKVRLAREPLLIWAVIGVVVFGLGRVIDQLTLGRSIAFIAIAIDTRVGEEVATIVDHPHSDSMRGRYDRLFLGVVGVAMIVGLCANLQTVVKMIPRQVLPGSVRSRAELQPVTAPYTFLSRIPGNSVVLGWPGSVAAAEPAFGGKELWPWYPYPFVKRADRWLKETAQFFSPTETHSQRRALLATEHVDYVVIDDRSVPAKQLTAIEAEGRVVVIRQHIIVIEVGPSQPQR